MAELQEKEDEAIAKLWCVSRESNNWLCERFYLALGAWSPLDDDNFQDELRKPDTPLAKALGAWWPLVGALLAAWWLLVDLLDFL